jgi:hypothetical protein
MTERDILRRKIAEAITSGLEPKVRDALLFEVAAWQSRTNPVFAKLCRAHRVDFAAPRAPSEWPAIPTDLFRHMRVSTYVDSAFDIRVFHTSGTTSGARGAHSFRDLSLYDLAAQHAARMFLLPFNMRLAMLAAHPLEVSDSSLSYMLGRFESWFGTSTHWCWRDNALDLDALRRSLDEAVRTNEPIAVLGTSFALVHADDRLQRGERWQLPTGSVVMPTGGFKGRSREIDKDELHAMITTRFGAGTSFIGEYGMTELSSQMYEIDGKLAIPSWVRATPVDPDTLRPVSEGEVGIVRIDDLANLDSAISIQTADLARLDKGRLTLLGRAPGATPRGCSLAIEEALS